MATKTTTARKWNGMNWIRQEKRAAIYHRDGDTCCYCGYDAKKGRRKMSLDHVIPVALGGTNDASNLVMACLKCNSAKQEMSLDAFAAYLATTGADAKAVFGRITARTAAPLDMAEGRRRVATRKARRRSKKAKQPVA